MKSTDRPDRLTRRAQILASAESALHQRIQRRRIILAGSGTVAIAGALFIAWFISPFAKHSPTIHSNPTIATTDPAPQSTSSTLAWISTQSATGSWLADAAPTQDWLIGPRPDPDWLTTSSREFSIASDDDFDHLMALLPEAESRGSIRINGKIVLPRDLPPIEALHEPTPDDPR